MWVAAVEVGLVGQGNRLAYRHRLERRVVIHGYGAMVVKRQGEHQTRKPRATAVMPETPSSPTPTDDTVRR